MPNDVFNLYTPQSFSRELNTKLWQPTAGSTERLYESLGKYQQTFQIILTEMKQAESLNLI